MSNFPYQGLGYGSQMGQPAGYGQIGQLGQPGWQPAQYTLETMVDLIVAKTAAANHELDLEAIRKVVREELDRGKAQTGQDDTHAGQPDTQSPQEDSEAVRREP